MARRMPAQRPGKSDSVVITPPEFMTAVKRKLRIKDFQFDLAASADNSQGLAYMDESMDSLQQDWKNSFSLKGWNWLNMPYDRISPWVLKCDETTHNKERDWRAGTFKVAALLPASVGSNWWAQNVHNKCKVLFLNGRILFLDRYHKPIASKKTGKPTPYPKDLALLLYGTGETGYDIWRWRDE